MKKSAGQPVKQDVVVNITDTSSTLQIHISSPVLGLFGSAIKKAVHGELEQLGVKNGTVTIDDYQALNFVIRARVRTAVTALRESGGHI